MNISVFCYHFFFLFCVYEYTGPVAIGIALWYELGRRWKEKRDSKSQTHTHQAANRSQMWRKERDKRIYGNTKGRIYLAKVSWEYCETMKHWMGIEKYCMEYVIVVLACIAGWFYTLCLLALPLLFISSASVCNIRMLLIYTHMTYLKVSHHLFFFFAFLFFSVCFLTRCCFCFCCCSCWHGVRGAINLLCKRVNCFAALHFWCLCML